MADGAGGIRVIAGAPGSGKSTTVAACLALRTPLVFLDMDWLLDPCSALVGTDIRFAPDTWPPYNALWSTLLTRLAGNHLSPVLFAPGMLDGIPPEHHLHLDCAEATRRARLKARGWDAARIAEALQDAAELRRAIPGQSLDSAALTPDRIATLIAAWAAQPSGS